MVLDSCATEDYTRSQNKANPTTCSQLLSQPYSIERELGTGMSIVLQFGTICLVSKSKPCKSSFMVEIGDETAWCIVVDDGLVYTDGQCRQSEAAR